MDSKNYTQVLIDGKIYTLGGSEDEGYLQKTASYVNEKNNVLRKIPGFSKQSVEYRTAMVELNLADDYFKALERGTEVERQRDDMEREMYSLKHELVSTQMKLEVVLKDLEERQRELEELTREKNRLDRKIKSMEKTQPEAVASAGADETGPARTGGVSYRVKRAARPMLMGRESGEGPDNQADSGGPEPASIENADKKGSGQVAVTVELEAEVTEVEVTEVLTQTAGTPGDGREAVDAAQDGAADGQEVSEEITQESEAAEYHIRETQGGHAQETASKEAMTRETNQQLTQKALHAAMAARKKKKR